MKNITELTEATFQAEVLRANGLVLVDFYDPWCGPCKMLAPLLEQLATELAGQVKITKFNVYDAPQFADEHGISALPTLMLFRGGAVVDGVVGMQMPAKLKGWIAQHATQAAA